MAKKKFVLDTNILLSFPHSMAEDFGDNTVIICGTVLQELNAKKNAEGEVGYNAREAGRLLDFYRQKGDLLVGVDTESGGKLVFVPDGVRQDYLPDGFSVSVPDNRIISTCIHIMRQQGSDDACPTILVTSDILMRLSATACGVEVQEFKKVMVAESDYTGHVSVQRDWHDIERLFKEKAIPAEGDFLENEFVTVQDGAMSAICVHRGGLLRLIEKQSLFG